MLLFRLRLRNSERALYERLLDEKDKQLRIVIAEVDYLRATRGQPSLPAAINPSGLPEKGAATVTDGGWVSEADEAEAIIAKAGLSVAHLPEILSGLGYSDSELS